MKAELKNDFFEVDISGQIQYACDILKYANEDDFKVIATGACKAYSDGKNKQKYSPRDGYKAND